MDGAGHVVTHIGPMGLQIHKELGQQTLMLLRVMTGFDRCAIYEDDVYEDVKHVMNLNGCLLHTGRT